MGAREKTEPTDSEVSDESALPLPALLFWKLTRLVMRLLGKLAFAVGTSVGAALILLVGVNAVLGFGILGLSFAMALLKTAVNLVLLFVACTIASCVAFVAIAGALVFVSSIRNTVVRRWRLRRVQLLARMAVRRMRALVMLEVAVIVLIMVVVLMFAYLQMRDPKAWNETLSVRLPTRAPVERIGRSETPPQVSKLADVQNYVKVRRDKVAAQVNTMTQRGTARGDRPLISRCGNAIPLDPAEVRLVAELYIDLTQDPPIVKREYILTEEQLTAALSLLAEKWGDDRVRRRAAEDDEQGDEDHASSTFDCVKLHRNYIRLFTTSVDADRTIQNHAFGVSVLKDVGSLNMLLDELSFGRASFQVGWLGLGVTGSREGLTSDAEGNEELAGALRAFDSRVFSINVFEGYLRIVTWRLPSVVAARAAIDVGYTQQTVEHRVEPKEDAASLGVIRAGDLVYVLERTDEWLYVCSEVSGRFGWLPKSTFTSLENWPGFLTQRQVIRSQKH